MPAELSLGEKSLGETLADLQNRVRSDPGNWKYRVFLFQLLSVLGQWDRALTQLNVAGDLDAQTLALVQMYREALRCEVLRAQVFAGKRSPIVFGEPEQWVAMLVEALRLTAEGQHPRAKALRDAAFEAAPATNGSIVLESDAPEPGAADDTPPAGQRFEWIADADSRLGPVLEAIVNGRYYWVPFSRIRRMQVEKPTDLRDLVWTAAHFEWETGGESVGLIPTRYPGSEASEDDAIRLARKTDWSEVGSDSYHGLGQRMLAADTGDFSLLDIRLVTLDQAGAGAGA